MKLELVPKHITGGRSKAARIERCKNVWRGGYDRRKVAREHDDLIETPTAPLRGNNSPK